MAVLEKDTNHHYRAENNLCPMIQDLALYKKRPERRTRRPIGQIRSTLGCKDVKNVTQEISTSQCKSLKKDAAEKESKIKRPPPTVED